MNQITDQIFLGNFIAAEDWASLKFNDINYILSIGVDPTKIDGLVYLYFEADDSDE